MSRTIRRKGKVPDWLYDKHFKFVSSIKVTRTYTRWYKKEKHEATRSFYPIYWIMLPKQEWTLSNSDVVRYHSDKTWSNGARSWGKRFWAKKRRNHDRQEFAKWAKEEYEPEWFQTKIDTWWWD